MITYTEPPPKFHQKPIQNCQLFEIQIKKAMPFIRAAKIATITLEINLT
jgi:hypothetical protein